MYWSKGDGWFGWQSLQQRIIKLVVCQTLPVCDNVAAGADYLIAIGGGSPTDTSKAIGIIINNPEFSDVVSLEGCAATSKPCVPIFAIPTAAGTAAEVTINYVITDEQKKRKIVCVDPHDIPVIAVIDPEMMSSMPKGLTAATDMDALTHAIEGYITKAAWELTDMMHLKAIGMRPASPMVRRKRDFLEWEFTKKMNAVGL